MLPTVTVVVLLPHLEGQVVVARLDGRSSGCRRSRCPACLAIILSYTDLQAVIVLDDPLEVLLGVEIDLLRALLVLEAQLVEVGVAAARGAARLPAALGLVVR